MAPAQRNRPLRCPAADCHQRAFLHVTYAPHLELRADPWLKVAQLAAWKSALTAELGRWVKEDMLRKPAPGTFALHPDWIGPD
jgi:hypothetical protein